MGDAPSNLQLDVDSLVLVMAVAMLMCSFGRDYCHDKTSCSITNI